MKMDTDDTFFGGLNWKQLSQKTVKQIKLYQKIHPNFDVYGNKPCPPTKPTNLNQPNQGKPDSTKKKPPKQQYNDSNMAEPPAFQPTLNQVEFDKIREILKTETNSKYQLHTLHTEHPRNCPIHSGKPHPLLSCTILCRVCKDLDLALTLQHVQRTLNIKQYIPEYRRQNQHNLLSNTPQPQAQGNNAAPPQSRP